jgi:hypothetical protein
LFFTCLAVFSNVLPFLPRTTKLTNQQLPWHGVLQGQYRRSNRSRIDTNNGALWSIECCSQWMGTRLDFMGLIVQVRLASSSSSSSSSSFSSSSSASPVSSVLLLLSLRSWA